MSINIGICETESKNAMCRELKTNIIRVLVDDTKGFEDVSEFDCTVPLDEARMLIPDWEAFMKRNRINAETDAIYMDKVRSESDAAILGKKAERSYTGWIDLSKLDDRRRDLAVNASKKDNRLTGWDMLSFDEMNGTCSECPLSWDKGRGCIGSFGPDSSLLPEIAERRGCHMIASVPASVATGRRFTPSDAEEMLKEIGILTLALPDEGKVMVRRYSGPLERLGAVAEISVREGCGFYFF